MKTFVICTATLGLFTLAAFGQADVIARQRAKDLADQNNARQAGTPPATAPARPAATPTPMVAPATPPRPNQHQQNISKLKADLTRLHAEHKVTDKSKEEFVRDLLAVAQGSHKPSNAALSRLADGLLAALAPQNVTAAADEKLVQKLVVLVNSGGLTSTRTQEISNEAQAALQSAGVPTADAVKIAGDLQSVADDIRQPARL